MIRLNNGPSISTYISGNYITIANNNPITLTFSETDNSCPATVTPNSVAVAGTVLNLTYLYVNSNSNCVDPLNDFNNGAIYYYEVISSKVIYQRVDKSNNITFIDVSFRETYNHFHEIPTTNTTWIQNLNLVNSKPGAVIVQQYNEETLSWENVGYMAPNGSFTLYRGLDKEENRVCKFRSKYIIRERQHCGGTSPIVFETIGQEFDLILKYYEEDNLYIKDVLINNKEKYNLCESEPIDFLSVEADQPFEVLYDSYNIDYVYQYLSSNGLLTPILNTLSYNEVNHTIESIINSETPRQPKTLVTVEFLGCRNEFINGQLITNTSCEGGLNAEVGDYNCLEYSEDFNTNCRENLPETIISEIKTIYIEGIKPEISLITQKDCSYCLDIADGTVVENPCLNGQVYYEYRSNEEQEWIPITVKDKGYAPLSIIKYCFCEAGEVQIRVKYKYSKISTCHKFFLKFETEWYEYSSEVLEFKPKIEAIIQYDNSCCTTLDYTNETNQFISIVPTVLESNSYSCQIEPKTPSKLSYTLEEYNIIDCIWEPVDTLILDILETDYDSDTFVITNSVLLEKYKYLIDKTKISQGAYRILYSLENCCTKDEEVLYLNICDSLDIKKDCDLDGTADCNCYKYTFTNYSSTDSYTVDVYNTEVQKITDTIQIAPNQVLDYLFTNDGIYTFTITNNNGLSTVGKYTNPYVVPIFLFCRIDSCYTKIIQDVLCSNNPDCFCEDEELVKDRARLNKIMLLYQTWMLMIKKDFTLMSRYNSFDVENKLKSFNSLNKIYAQILKFCEPCFDGTKSNCCS